MSQEQTERYAAGCLAGCGFAIMDSRISYRLRPDVWASPEESGFFFKKLTVRPAGTKRFAVDISGYGECLVLCWTEIRLPERIEEILGLEVTAIRPFVEPVVEPPKDFRTYDQLRVKKAKEDALKEIAARPLPSHDCHERREILDARKRLEAHA